ncbi:MAG TPA: serine hydrolase [Candidatus Aminicenantes bacterium]|nr:serine hydrolase [Candidatus Aminicenantes bacterium]HRY65457.1 serine hydrolase [Candidatus Aminicenantes bacterium]HRZ72075.1 serine hydrolase [Candidatus Aminicenantes bacterium]
MIRIAKAAVPALALLGLVSLVRPAAAPSPDGALAARIDAVMAEVYKPNQPGAAIIVRRNGRTLFRKGYGLADLELGVPVAPDMIFRLGSITKQFTAVSILLLAQEGKLGLQDEITRFLPDYPTQGRKITVEHLLTHTSGIQSYTELAEWLPLWRKDFTVRELIALFKDKPMQFEPGRSWAYNNSGYILLGAIIEKVSGKTYEQFVEERIFKPLGLKDSSYDHTERVLPRRVRGYHADKDGFVNAPYLSMTQPYAAGSLLSTIDDLAVWSDAVLSGRLVGKEWLDKAWTPCRLADGESSGYGYGWFISDFAGHRSIEHGGGINGFTTYELTFPEDGIFIAILTNSAVAGRAPEARAVKIAWLTLGLTEPKRKAVAVPAAELDKLAGVYADEQKNEYRISQEGGRLLAQRQGGSKSELYPASPTEFFLKDNPARFLFVRDAAGRTTGLRILSRIGPVQVFPRTDKALPAPPKEMALDPGLYDRLVGDYELTPGFIIRILRRGDTLISQATGQPEVQLFPESPTRFFLKVVDAQVDFVLDADGRTTGLVLHQGGQDLPARKLQTP